MFLPRCVQYVAGRHRVTTCVEHPQPATALRRIEMGSAGSFSYKPNTQLLLTKISAGHSSSVRCHDLSGL